MSTMQRVEITGPGAYEVLNVERPRAGVRDVVVRVRACGICGSDTAYIAMGGLGGAPMPLGHEAAGEVVEVGAEVAGIAVGDRVMVNPMAAPTGVMGNGGALGALAEYLLIEDAVLGHSIQVFPADIDFEVAALNEPMAVARHLVNRAGPKRGDTAVVFGAGPIGLGAAIWLKLRGLSHVVVADVIPERLERALAIGADAVINSATENVGQRLRTLHGAAINGAGQERAGTDYYFDAAGVGAVITETVNNAKLGATLATAAMHKRPVEIEVGAMLPAELTWVFSMGYPTEIFEVSADLVAHADRFRHLISHTVPFSEVTHALELALTPGAADKVVVSFP